MGCGSGFEGVGTRSCRSDARLPEMHQSVDPGANTEADPLGRPRGVQACRIKIEMALDVRLFFAI